MSRQSKPVVVPFDEALQRYLTVSGISRRQFISRIAALGAVAAIGGIVEACVSAAQSPSPLPATPAPTAAGAATAVATATPVPTPIPSPEAELFVYNWDGYIGSNTVSDFSKKYGIKVTYDKFPDEPTQIAKLQSDGKGGGYDVSYPASTWLPSFVADGIVQPIQPSLVPNLANLAPEWQNPGYDPNNAHSVPNYWWTTGYAWDPAKLPGQYSAWADLWNPNLKGHLGMLDDMREVFATAAFQLGLSPNTVDEGELDQILAKLEVQKPLVRIWTDDDIGDFESGQLWITHCWSGDWYQMTSDKPNAQYVIPSEGSIRGNDTMVILSGAKHPIAAHLWINYNLDPQVSANNTNEIGYMGPNAAALPLIDPTIKNDPRLNPPDSVKAKLVELAYLAPADLDKYTKRWQLLRA
ncbi:MAG TPA: spermidine/putrescine ABC transporter substrate-binding protein [Candidatus Limnocylindrales bacterium]|nr:spermidine/putrescine ABC transporter substrate-binding protein [Candidatus Limnocylindrales bacterium]